MLATSASPEVRLYVVNGRNSGESIRVRGPAFRIGRAPGCQLRPDSDRVSRHHAEIDMEGERVFLRDLCSRNGTYLNGERIHRPTPLGDGDRIGIGPLLLVVTIWSPETTTEGDDSGGASRAEGALPELPPEDEALFPAMPITDADEPERPEGD
jgi:pSer/pThr/pTyr-binding forkhead associated (FHA) protein